MEKVKGLIIVALLMVATQGIYAQVFDQSNDAIWKDRAKYFNIGYIANQSLKPNDTGSDNLEWKSAFGASLNSGRTYYLHKKPLLNMIKFGIDWSWLDLNYVKYKKLNLSNDYSDPDDYYEDEESFDFGVHQLEAGMRVGPSVTVNPIDHLKVSAYFHFIPSYSLIVLDDEVNHGYVSNFTFGGAISYKVISLGFEGRWGKAKYNNISFNDDEDDYDDYYDSSYDNGYDGDYSYGDAIGDMLDKKKMKFKNSSFRVYIGFRF